MSDICMFLTLQKKQKGDFSELEFFKSVYSEGDGSFKEGTTSRQFVVYIPMKISLTTNLLALCQVL